MCKPNGTIIIVGTYVYEGDLLERLAKNKAYQLGFYPAINERGEPLWPQRWPLEKLEERRLEVGDYAFAKEYLLQKIALGSQFFKRDMFKFYDPNNVPSRLFRLISVDPAISTDGDYTAIVVTGTSDENKTYLLDYANIRTDDVQLIVDEIFRLVQANSVPYIQIETIGFQRLLKEWLYEKMREKNYHFGIEEARHYRSSKEARIMALQPRIAAGSLLFHPAAQEEVINQFLAFPRGLHDDLCDGLAMEIGKWDKPGPIIEPVPYNSFVWWQEKLKPQANSWQEALQL
jgi:predicted phage terminase large subunit-like protein